MSLNMGCDQVPKIPNSQFSTLNTPSLTPVIHNFYSLKSSKKFYSVSNMDEVHLILKKKPFPLPWSQISGSIYRTFI